MTTPFLVFALLFPRLTLLVYWLAGWMPANDTGFALDVVGAIFAPRLLVGWWTYSGGEHPLWTAMFLLFAVGSMFSGNYARNGRESA